MARTAGEFPWTRCPQWLKDAGPFIRDIQFNIIYPCPGYLPLEPWSRSRRLQWGFPVSSTFSGQLVPPVGALNMQSVIAQWPPAPLLPGGLGGNVSGVPDPTNPLIPRPYAGQCQRAGIEANRLRQTCLPAAPPPGVPGFTGFTLRDLRSIAKAFSEPSIYAIQD